jgi:hypothetical protein
LSCPLDVVVPLGKSPAPLVGAIELKDRAATPGWSRKVALLRPRILICCRGRDPARDCHDLGMTLIEDYAMLGDLPTAALVSNTGSVDWLRFPRFDSPACFAA